MKNSLLIHALAGGAAASQMTLPFIDNAAIVAAVDPADPGFKVCSVANQKLQVCVRRAGGSGGLATAAPDELAQCACCEGNRPVDAAYASCSSYLVEAEPTLSTAYSAFGRLYDICAANRGVCSGRAVSATAVSGTATAKRLTTARGAEPTASYAPACNSLGGLFESCSMEIPGFADLPFGRQAPCYCCITARGQVSWTDEFDKYAQTCRDWARDSGPKSIYTLARSFATFCRRFSDACSSTNALSLTEATATTSTDAEATDDATTTPGGGADQASRTASTAASSSTGSAASNMRVGSAAGFIMVAAAVVVAI
ncbi:hypothetical protein HRG_008132 [Hirsutella rhossiliensis]|uniref:Uncharacterized protein n=1 Tax=Hirsutella rhossiliensis TaxID=111463 RepID=A0A9P8SGC1_9HYPO|nr:uncharacterized protein HRG_08132 [Hirsutella rhossiliensis]KAH0960979.1 hypothetical protein HRG_08132 [Hirsutella rhossiliensis]